MVLLYNLDNFSTQSVKPEKKLLGALLDMYTANLSNFMQFEYRLISYFRVLNTEYCTLKHGQISSF